MRCCQPSDFTSEALHSRKPKVLASFVHTVAAMTSPGFTACR